MSVKAKKFGRPPKKQPIGPSVKDSLMPHLPALLDRQAMEEDISGLLQDIQEKQGLFFAQALKYLTHSFDVSSHALLENQSLRGQLADIKKHASPGLDAHSSAKDFLQKQEEQSSRLLIRKDNEARHALAESRSLRTQLKALQEQTLQQQLAKIQQPEAPPGSPQYMDPPGVPDLLDQMRVPKQSYAAGNFLKDAKEEESSSEDDDLFKLPDKLKKKGGLKRGKTLSLLDMKQRMENMFADKSRSNDVYCETGWAQWMVKHQYFEYVSMSAILLNVVWIGIDTAYNPSDVLLYAHPVFIIFEQLFCFIFTAELLIRFSAYKSTSKALTTASFLFDSCLVLAMVVETWILLLFMYATGDSVDFFDPTALRLLRLLRLSKVARIIRFLRAVPEVMILLKAIGIAARSVCVTMCLLFVVVYVFAIAFTHACKDTHSGKLYFNSLNDSMFTLFYFGCFGTDTLAAIADALYTDNFLLGTLLGLYILLAPFTVLNLLVGILVEVVSVVARAETEAMDVAYISDSIQEMLHYNSSQPNVLRSEDVYSLLESQDALLTFTEVGIDIPSIDPDLMFEKVDELSFREFINELLCLRVTNNATLKDVVHCRKTLMNEIREALGNQLQAMGQGLEKTLKKSEKKKSMSFPMHRKR